VTVNPDSSLDRLAEAGRGQGQAIAVKRVLAYDHGDATFAHE
jgi:hypothetical protein